MDCHDGMLASHNGDGLVGPEDNIKALHCRVKKISSFNLGYRLPQLQLGMKS